MRRILVTNDDGITTRGIAKLAEAMGHLGEVFVVAPDGEMSAISHALTLKKPLIVSEIKKNWFSVAGTPTDCVYLALKKLITEKIDLVVSGINKGANLGEDVHYSGTVAGAVEGNILGKPAVAFSQVSGEVEDLDADAEVALAIVSLTLEAEIGTTALLNVNFPPCKSKGIKLTRLGDRNYEDTITETILSDRVRSYTISGKAVHLDQSPETDCQMSEEGYITVTPLKTDLSDFEAFARMTSWDLFR